MTTLMIPAREVFRIQEDPQFNDWLKSKNIKQPTIDVSTMHITRELLVSVIFATPADAMVFKLTWL